MTHLQAVYLYDDPDTAGLDIDYLAGYLATEAPGLQVGVRTDFLPHHFGRFHRSIEGPSASWSANSPGLAPPRTWMPTKRGFRGRRLTSMMSTSPAFCRLRCVC